MEEFKASLQLYSFEQQTKFVALHQRRVEVLENLYLKFMAFADVQDRWVTGYQVTSDKAKTIEMIEEVMSYLNEFWGYFEKNRIFIPDDVVKEVARVWESAGYWNAVLLEQVMSDAELIEKFNTQTNVHKLTMEMERIYKSVTDTTKI